MSLATTSTTSTTSPPRPAAEVSRSYARPDYTRPITGGDVWERLAECESGMKNDNTGNGFYGFFQFLAATFRSITGLPGLPSDYPWSVQLAAAQRLYARSGRSQWPICGARAGLA